MIEKDFGFIYLEKNEIAYYMANLWRGEVTIQNMKSMKYSDESIEKFFISLRNQIEKKWDGKTQFRITRKGKSPDAILHKACIDSGIWYEDLPKEHSFFSPKGFIIEWRKQNHPCKFHKSRLSDFKFLEMTDNK
jgi:hypothetical protein